MRHRGVSRICHRDPVCLLFQRVWERLEEGVLHAMVRQLKLHEMGFHYSGPEDTEAIDLAFSKKRADDRKTWIAQCEDNDVQIRPLQGEVTRHCLALQLSAASQGCTVPSHLVSATFIDIYRLKYAHACCKRGVKIHVDLTNKILWKCTTRDDSDDQYTIHKNVIVISLADKLSRDPGRLDGAASCYM